MTRQIAALAILVAGATPLMAQENISVGDMPRYCQFEAASAYNAPRSDVTTLPAEQDQGMYSVYGQTPADANDSNGLFFICTFNGDGQFVGVDVQSDNRQAGGSTSAGGIALADMPRYCAGEAAARFDQRPGNITTNDPIQDQGMYSVFGQFPPSGSDATVFICTFGSDGAFVGVDPE